uniref:BED-type domain-containing protein n=1 Tax=Parastrongyloides trichosuri TaxID=131310 RepID=A0A0N4Z5Q8_PARTI
MNKNDVYEQFELLQNNKVRCIQCGTELSNIVGNLKRHLGTKHKKTHIGKIINDVKVKKMEKQSTAFEKEFDQLIVRLGALPSFPLYLIETPVFKELIHFLNKDVTLKSRKTIMRKTDELYDTLFQKFINELREEDSLFHISLDF